MATYKIEQEHDSCISCGACTASCPLWVMGKDGKAEMKGGKTSVETDDLGCHMQAAQACPVNIIHVTENGKKLI